MIEFVEGLIMLIVPLSIVGLFLFKWRKEYKQSGRILLLHDKKMKRWKFAIYFLFLIFSVIVILAAISVINEENNLPIKILPERYNPWGWYL